MNIYVLMKRTFDTEERIQLQGDRIDEDSAEFIINPYDEYAIEEAVKLKESHDGEIVVLTVGTEESEKELRTALAMGADRAVLINAEDDYEDLDSSSVARIIAAYVAAQDVDVILAGNVAIDGGSGSVGPAVAELLDIPYVTTAVELIIDGTTAHITRDAEGDTEKVSVQLPFLMTCQQGLNEPRYPSLPGIMKAKKKPLDEVALDDIEVDDYEALTRREALSLPADKAAGRILDGELTAQIDELVGLLIHDRKIVG
ncbi:electron transfer flavoprotein subunit beta/FixA family protein [Macrococcus equipercicus]|uniref:Electron transfer flavoprotein subunit beta n=1 Tax=Macrococcus equipercicus TaxID=69967 RepID=A0A9Q9BK59_9STAP|nr:electron transfer flavoprotein subunit beta/FixA family protein [Macrococcus equipercicus]KAA1039968.1 electron transfer flavoprotein subunit beta/FixA family protein [Macrococcus equipercicus]UTH13098.1 electron transfer flavoprotein subunit beta/FixA family protein [Macrococcus equipercicus]